MTPTSDNITQDDDDRDDDLDEEAESANGGDLEHRFHPGSPREKPSACQLGRRRARSTLQELGRRCLDRELSDAHRHREHIHRSEPRRDQPAMPPLERSADASQPVSAR